MQDHLLALRCTLVLAAAFVAPGLAVADDSSAADRYKETRDFILYQAANLAIEAADEMGMRLPVYAGLQSCDKRRVAEAVGIDWDLMNAKVTAMALGNPNVQAHRLEIDAAVRAAIVLYLRGYEEALRMTYTQTPSPKERMCAGFVELANEELLNALTSKGE
jgi:hypothetical protein